MADDSELRESLQTSVEWKIKKFSDLPKEIDYFLESHLFSLSKSRWHLQIYPNGQSHELSSGYVGVYLLKKTSAEELRVAFSLEIRSIDGSRIDFDDNFRFEKKSRGLGSTKFCKRSEIMDFVASDGSLTLFCIVHVTDKFLISSSTETAEAASQKSWSDSLMSENFKNLYISQQFADVQIIVGGRKFLGHRSVLAARSTVFSEMLSTEMVEKNNGLIEITDCDRDSFEDFLHFLYTGDIGIVSITNATSLYGASEKYDIKDLKAECVRCMITKLNVDSFCDVLRIASLHNESDMLVAATNYFRTNAKNILVTSKWRNFIEKYPLAGNELFLKYVNTQKTMHFTDFVNKQNSSY